jgi:putative ABC transport system substrate-binding protein
VIVVIRRNLDEGRHAIERGAFMQRREFITLLGGAAAVWPLAARAQQAEKLPTIGILGSSSADWSHWLGAFVQRLHELGWIENRTVTIDHRWTEGRNELYAEFAAELARRKVDVILPLGTPAIIAAKKATSVVPIVFPLASDPVGEGLVASLAHPGGNITGLSNQQPDLAGKRLEILRDIIPGLRQLAVLANANNRTATLSVDEVRLAARKLGFEIVAVDVKRGDDIAPAIEGLKGRVQAVYVVGDPLVADNQIQINTLALAARLPTMHISRGYVDTGGFVSYGPDFSALFRHAGDYVDKILKGAKPADLPVEEPIKIELVVNLKTAKALALTIPEPFLLRADEVIE